MGFTREQIRESIERAGDEHWQALIRHHEDAYPASRPTPGDVARAEAERLNALGLGDNANVKLIESRVERLPSQVRITHVFEDRSKGTRLPTADQALVQSPPRVTRLRGSSLALLAPQPPPRRTDGG